MMTTTSIPGARAVDLGRVRPFGDTLDDGKVQLSFTLPVPMGPEAEEAALALMRGWGFAEPAVVDTQDMHNGYTFFVAYGASQSSVDYTAIQVPRAQTILLDRQEVEARIAAATGDRPLRILGACTGSDAHTVGIDAILNVKGINGHKGLESYRGFEVRNLGAQVENGRLLAEARAFAADAVLISQIVTQKNVHVQNLTEFIEMAEAEGLREQLICIVGGPRLGHELAMELGFDAGFGRGSYADDVASFLAQEASRRAPDREKEPTPTRGRSQP